MELDLQYRLTVSLDLMVNKQNTSDPADWHLPTDDQLGEYRQAIAGTVTSALAAICMKPGWKERWSGTHELTCEGLKTLDGAIVKTPIDGSTDPRVTKVRPEHHDLP